MQFSLFMFQLYELSPPNFPLVTTGPQSLRCRCKSLALVIYASFIIRQTGDRGI